MKSGVAKRGPLQTPRTLLPDVETLSACLTAAFDGHDSCGAFTSSTGICRCAFRPV